MTAIGCHCLDCAPPRPSDPDKYGWRMFDWRMGKLVEHVKTDADMDVAFCRYFAHLRKLGVAKGPPPRSRNHWAFRPSTVPLAA